MNKKSIKILIVDDLLAMRNEFISMCFDYVPDAEIDEASNVMDAVDLLQHAQRPYDVVFTDVNMPDVSGLKLIPILRELPQYKNTPLIVLSTVTSRSDIARALQLGATAYLTRPYKREYFEIIYLAYLAPLLPKKDGISD